MSGVRALTVLEPGPTSLVVDHGRPGMAGLGVAESGALDPRAMALANRLVGNPEHDAGLEVLLGGLALRARHPTVLAVTGAPVPVAVAAPDGTVRTHGSGAALAVPAGGEVRLAPPERGVRSWLAVRGGLAVTRLLGSASTDLLAGLGAPLAAGDELPVGDEPTSGVPAVDQAPLPAPSDGPLTLRAVPGPRDGWFAADALEVLRGPWRVDPRSNRVGLRLEAVGEATLERSRTDELPSEGAVAGAVQVAAGGLPVVFLADHPVTGGYPVIACVVRADLPLAAQAAPGQEIRFAYVPGPTLPGPASGSGSGPGPEVGDGDWAAPGGRT